jgi:hypothetical protein
MSTIKQNAEKLSKHSKEVLGTKISLSKSLELLSRMEGFNNSNTAIAKEKDFTTNVINAHNIFLNLKDNNFIRINKKIEINANQAFEEKDLLKILRLKDLKWKIDQMHTRVNNIQHIIYHYYLEGSIFKIRLNTITIPKDLIDKTEKNREIPNIHNQYKNNYLILSLLINPIQHQGLNHITQEEINLGIKKLKDYKIKINNKITNFGQGIEFNSINNKEGKPLFTSIRKEALKSQYSFLNYAILDKMNIKKETQDKLWDHLKKYNANKLWIMGECPNCGSSEDIPYDYYIEKSDYWIDCQDCRHEYEKEDLENKYYYFSLK